MGEAKSLLTVDELLDALHDPRFQVRFEALISIAPDAARAAPCEALIETQPPNWRYRPWRRGP